MVVVIIPIPESITINGIVIQIFHIKHLMRDYGRFGEYSSCEMRINIDDDMTEQKKELVFCHEMIEAIDDIYSLSMDHAHIQPIAVAIYDIIKNKKVEF